MNSFLIVGDTISDEVVFWSNKLKDWGSIDEATRFPISIFSEDLSLLNPTGIAEVNSNGAIVNYYYFNSIGE